MPRRSPAADSLLDTEYRRTGGVRLTAGPTDDATLAAGYLGGVAGSPWLP